MARQKKQEEPPKGAPAFMATYGDLVTLLLCFFVLLFAMSEVSNEAFADVLASFGNPHFANPSNPIIMPPGSGVSMGSGIVQMPVPHSNRFEHDGQTMNNDEIQMSLQSIITDFETYFTESQNPFSEDVHFELIDDEEIHINFPNNMLFAVGSDFLQPQTIDMIDYIGGVISEHPGMEVRIYGHTDSVPINSIRFPDNYWLGFGRARAVQQRIASVHGVSTSRMHANSRGDTQPVASNETPEGRQANRRVEIIISPMR